MNALVTVQPQYAVSDLERIAHAFAASRLFGLQNDEQALALCLVAQAEGRHPASAAQDYHIISGKPAKKADAMLRDFITSGGKVEWHQLDDTKADATFSHPSGGSVRIDWTMARAQAAGLATPMWKKYPRQMLRSRVVSEGVRTVCPGATSGMYVPEELQDIAAEREPTTVEQVVDNPPQPKPPSSAQLKREGTWTKLKEEMDACKTVAELNAWNIKREAEIKALPPKWYDAAADYFEASMKALERAAADPKGVFILIPDENTPESWEEYFTQVLQIIGGAQSAEEVAEAQRVNGDGLLICAGAVDDALARVATAAENRLAELAA